MKAVVKVARAADDGESRKIWRQGRTGKYWSIPWISFLFMTTDGSTFLFSSSFFMNTRNCHNSFHCENIKLPTKLLEKIHCGPFDNEVILASYASSVFVPFLNSYQKAISEQMIRAGKRMHFCLDTWVSEKLASLRKNVYLVRPVRSQVLTTELDP